jgi:hypothetical protein
MVESAWFTTYAKRDGIVTPIVTVAVVLPAELLAVTVWIVVADACVGVPVIEPVCVSRSIPGGSDGETENEDWLPS